MVGSSHTNDLGIINYDEVTGRDFEGKQVTVLL